MTSPTPKVSVLFVCMGNICRSPSAEGVFRHQVEQAGLSDAIRIDSAGTHAYHVGEPPDSRSMAHAAKRGYDLGSQRARQVCGDDFRTFDLILAMDRNNLNALKLGSDVTYHEKIQLFLDFLPPETPKALKLSEVPDPYYGGDAGFEQVLDLVTLASEGLLAYLKTQYALM